MKKQIVIASLNITTEFEASAGATHRKLIELGAKIGLSSVKLLQNGSKTEVAGIKVVEVKEEEKKERKARTSKVFEVLAEQHPSLNVMVSKGFKPCHMENKTHTRVGFKKEEQFYMMNIGKRGVHVINMEAAPADRVKVTYANVESAVKAIVG